MDFLRELVSQKKIRLKNKAFNLDLTYITPRIIAMAKPSTNFIEGLYRNQTSDVNLILEKIKKF